MALRPAIGGDMGEQTHFVGADGLQQIVEKTAKAFWGMGEGPWIRRILREEHCRGAQK